MYAFTDFNQINVDGVIKATTKYLVGDPYPGDVVTLHDPVDDSFYAVCTFLRQQGILLYFQVEQYYFKD